MIDLDALKKNVETAKSAGVQGRKAELRLKKLAVGLIAEDILSKLPMIVESAVRSQSWAVVMRLSFGDLPVGYLPGSYMINGDDLLGAGKIVFDSCSKLNLNPRIDFDRTKAFILIEPKV